MKQGTRARGGRPGRATSMALWLSVFAFTSACAPPRPGRMGDYPKTIEVRHFSLSKQEARSFKFQADGSRGVREFEYAVPPFLGQSVPPLSCYREVSPWRMCPVLELSCKGGDGATRFEVELRKDGRLRVRLGPPWETTPEDLVETGLYIERGVEVEQVPTLDGELVEGIVDAESLELRAQPGRVSSPWFNRVNVQGTDIFVAIHEAQPHALQVMATLSLVGRLWAANAASFETCGFSS